MLAPISAVPTVIPTDQSRVELIISLLTEKTVAWLFPILEKASLLLGQLENTIQAVAVIFGDLSQERTVKAALLVWWQERWPVAKDAVEFHHLVADPARTRPQCAIIFASV